jgi:hypothetical protein
MWEGNGSVYRIWGRGADEIYAIGMGFGPSGESDVMRYDGTGWKPLPALPEYKADTLYDITADPGGDIWVVGEYELSESNIYPFLGRFDGTSWHVAIDRNNVHDDDEGQHFGTLNAIHFFDDGKAVAVGPHMMYLYDGAQWNRIEKVLENGDWHWLTYYSGQAVWGVSAQDFHVAVYASGIYRVSCDW